MEKEPEHKLWSGVESLKLWPKNYQSGDVGAIMTSIRRYGFNKAPRVWNGTVMAGNHSLMALRQLIKDGGWEPKGGSLRLNGDGVEIQIVDISHLSEQEAEGFAIADNRLAELASHDDEALAALLQDLAAADMALLESTGYDGDDLDAMLAELGMDIIIPPDSEQPKPELDYDHIIEIGCDADRLKTVTDCIEKLKGVRGVQINIS